MSVLELPGFRFHPTEEELLNFYLRRIATGKKLHFDFIGLLYIYHHEPWELPGLAKIEGREWYFFVPRDKRHGHGGRPNRTTKNGFWKATGSDRQIRCLTEPTSVLGIKKTLVFYQGRAPRGCKTDWIMNEYRLPDSFPSPKEDIVLCKIYRKATSVKVLEQRASMENQVRITHLPPSSPLSEDTLTSYDHPQENFPTPMLLQDLAVKTEEEEEEENNNKITTPSEGFRFAKENLKELEVPKFNIDLLVEPLLNQFSPWLDQYWSPFYANVLNF